MLLLICQGLAVAKASSLPLTGLPGDVWARGRLLCSVPLEMMLRLPNTGKLVKIMRMVKKMIKMIKMIKMMIKMKKMMMHRALLTSEGLLDLLVGSVGNQTGRCLSLEQHTF